MTPKSRERWEAYEKRRNRKRRAQAAFDDLVTRAFHKQMSALSAVRDRIAGGSAEEREMIARSIYEIVLRLPKRSGRPSPSEADEPRPSGEQAEVRLAWSEWSEANEPPPPSREEAEVRVAFSVQWSEGCLRRRYGLARLTAKWRSNERREPDQSMRDKLINDAIEEAENEQPDLKGRLRISTIKSHLSKPKRLHERGSYLVMVNNLGPEDLPTLHEHYVYDRGCFRDAPDAARQRAQPSRRSFAPAERAKSSP
jgi:hypothetical protein